MVLCYVDLAPPHIHNVNTRMQVMGSDDPKHTFSVYVDPEDVSVSTYIQGVVIYSRTSSRIFCDASRCGSCQCAVGVLRYLLEC